MVLRRPVNRSVEARTHSQLVPLGGWNTRDPLQAMSSKDAAIQTNILTDLEGPRLREGYQVYCTTGGSFVDFLQSFETPFGDRFIAASNKTLYDITTGSASSIKTGFLRDDWRGRVMNGRLGLVNGGDDPVTLSYSPANGVTLALMTISGPVQPAKLTVLHIFGSRSYFATGDEPAFWYSSTGALGGALTKFPIDRASNTGGNVVDLQSWTVDGGDGPDDYLVVFLSTGEVLVYRGTNPGDADNFSITGRYQAGKVIAAEPFAGQIHAVTSFDYNVFPRDFPTQGIRQPSKLSGAARKAVREKGGLARWQILFVPHLSLRIVNVPQSIGTYHQHVLNLATGAPALYKDLNATRWAVFKGELYFGDPSGNINRITGSSDSGSAITWELATGPDRLGSNEEKTVLEYRSVVNGEGTLTEATGLAFDYQPPAFIQDTTTQAVGTPWDTSPWDTSEWSSSPQTRGEWVSAGGAGQVVQFYSRGSVSGFRPLWRTIDYRYELSDTH